METNTETSVTHTGGPTKEELMADTKKGLIKDFEANLAKMNMIPTEIKQVEDGLVKLEEGMAIEVELQELKIKDLEFKANNFHIVDEQVKFGWEKNPDWLALQVKLLNAAKRKEEFTFESMKKSGIDAKSQMITQKAEIEKQMTRCQSHHKNALKQLKAECGVGDSEIQALKKTCKHPCCR